MGAGLCHSDLSTIKGTIPRLLPMILGHEVSGIVREVGPVVREVKPDDHVVFSFFPPVRTACSARLVDPRRTRGRIYHDGGWLRVFGQECAGRSRKGFNSSHYGIIRGRQQGIKLK